MALVRIDRNPSRRQLAVFGVAWLVVFGSFGGLLLARGHRPGVAAAVCLAAVLVPAFGWVAPAFMRAVYVGMAYLAMPISLVVSYTVLAATFYLVLVPIGLVIRAFGHDPLGRRFDHEAESYWIRRKADQEPRRYFRQY